MLKTLFRNAGIFDTESRGFFRGWLSVDGDRITGMGEGECPADIQADAEYDLDGAALIPGFIDVHTHGRVGEDFNFADAEGMKKTARSYASHGVTSLFPTLASAPYHELLESCALISSLKGKTGGADFLGVHLEGRYLNPAKRGAHAAGMLALPDAAEVPGIVKNSGLPLHITAALELEGAEAFADAASAAGATLGLGHTAATYAEAAEAYRRWGVSFTHLYNAMPPLHHRDGGPVLAAFDSGAFCELICDGLHIAPSMVAMTYRNVAQGRLVLISDSMAATDSADGEYSIAGNPAIVKNGIARTPDGALAGSTLSLDKAVENLASFCGIRLEDAIVCATANPASEVGVDSEVGTLCVGKRADMLAVRPDNPNRKLNIMRRFISGREYE